MNRYAQYLGPGVYTQLYDTSKRMHISTPSYQSTILLIFWSIGRILISTKFCFTSSWLSSWARFGRHCNFQKIGYIIDNVQDLAFDHLLLRLQFHLHASPCSIMQFFSLSSALMLPSKFSTARQNLTHSYIMILSNKKLDLGPFELCRASITPVYVPTRIVLLCLHVH